MKQNGFQSSVTSAKFNAPTGFTFEQWRSASTALFGGTDCQTDSMSLWFRSGILGFRLLRFGSTGVYTRRTEMLAISFSPFPVFLRSIASSSYLSFPILFILLFGFFFSSTFYSFRSQQLVAVADSSSKRRVPPYLKSSRSRVDFGPSELSAIWLTYRYVLARALALLWLCALCLCMSMNVSVCAVTPEFFLFPTTLPSMLAVMPLEAKARGLREVLCKRFILRPTKGPTPCRLPWSLLSVLTQVSWAHFQSELQK